MSCRPSTKTAVSRKSTGHNPLFLGPIFLHGHSDRLNDQHALTLGSDDKQSLCQCMQAFFPQASLVSCTKHLQENVRRQQGSYREKKLYHDIVGQCITISRYRRVQSGRRRSSPVVRQDDEDTGVDDSCCERRPVSAGDAMNSQPCYRNGWSAILLESPLVFI